MATNSLHHHHHLHHCLLKRHPSDTPPPSTLPSTLFPKPTTTTTTLSTSTTTCFSVSSSTTSATPTSTTSQPISFDLLQQHLSAQDFRQADEETRRLVIALAGEAALKRGYVFFSEVQFISEADLKAIDDLWRQYSDNRFGYSVQRRIWEKADRDFSKFFIKVGWMKKLDTEMEQYNYRSFPTEFIWELNKDTPEGHLPLTNALRGTQLLNRILTHPTFENVEEEDKQQEDNVGGGDKNSENGVVKGLSGSNPLSNKVFKPDYSF
ncbi:hypothetical protein JRO89_XS03G0017700 [Xanthoceras sorbifolium]|uniref:GUN4-like domain-containing protein n=1 Tax=Xanthoceras sorbifolium TaxID=99658 RepID=A0ABQ8I847_9ROSI|nr:hypothetical protein JRO89_XS03G0017700 [Xanthoceras sorbifolium]